MTFKFAGARAQVCKFCKFLVARTDRGLASVGRVADLVELPSPLSLGAMGKWGNQRFEVEGKVQLDRASAPGAPWQEFFVAFPETGEWTWVAFAQGRWYATREVPQPPPLPPVGQLRPGMPFQLGQFGTFTVAEVGQRRVVSADGELPHVAAPGAVTPYADVSGPNGAFGTIDYGDGQSIPPKLYLGRQFDPQTIKLDSGQPMEMAQAQAAEVACPNCGGSLPLVSPGTTERVVCKYCGTVSDTKSNGTLLQAIGQAPRPPVEPYIPLGREGQLRGNRVICIGFVVRGCTVEGERYRWREYLIYAGPTLSYAWLMEEDGRWQLVNTVAPGDVQVQGSSAIYNGAHYQLKQSVQASVEWVIGEFYWKVEIGETVQATEYEGPGGKVSVESGHGEVNTSFCAPIDGRELAQAFGLQPPPSAFAGDAASALGLGGGSSSGGMGCAKIILWSVIAIFILFVLAASDCEGDDGGGGVYIGPGFSGGK
jgi:hypothetical protein